MVDAEKSAGTEIVLPTDRPSPIRTLRRLDVRISSARFPKVADGFPKATNGKLKSLLADPDISLLLAARRIGGSRLPWPLGLDGMVAHAGDWPPPAAAVKGSCSKDSFFKDSLFKDSFSKDSVFKDLSDESLPGSLAGRPAPASRPPEKVR